VLSYREGFEDAVELCLYEASKAVGKKGAIEKLQEILGLVKEDKFQRIKEMLWMVNCE